MFSKSYREVEIYIPPPFEKKESILFIKSEDGEFVKLNKKTESVLRIFPFFQLRGSFYETLMEGENILNNENGYYRVRRVEKFEYDPEEVVARIFNLENKYYENHLKDNPVQRYLREFSSDLLNRFTKEGSRVLDLGSGPVPETLSLLNKCEVYFYDISEVALSNIKRRYPAAKTLGKESLLKLQEKFDLIFTSFGFLEMANTDFVNSIIEEKLRAGGLFIACYLNRLALLDLLLNISQFRIRYVFERLTGSIDGNHSRFSLGIRLVKERNIASSGLNIIDSYSICALVPPYYYRNLNERLNISNLIRMDRSISNLFPFKHIGDYKCIIGVKNG